jgi:uncharacterized protein YndB with AHSA1/START domain
MAEKISDEAVEKATGKSWDEWHRVLKEAVVNDWSHKDIVTFLRNEYNLSHWWAQTVTVNYEQFIGKRQVGQTQLSGYQIGVRKAFDISAEAAWELILSSKANQIWLGNNEIENFEKGNNYVTSEGTTGEIRVIKPNHHIRLSWKPKEWDKPSTLQIGVYTTPSGKTTIAIHQEKLKDEAVREHMREHWKKVLDRIEELL